jgi:hypothetical protein
MVALDSRWCSETLLCPRTYRPADVGFLRDVPRTYVLFVWLGFGLAIFLYAYDWRPSGWSVLRQQEAAAKPQRRDVEYNTGSIVIVPALLAAIDNRTGKMWDKGYVNCYEAVSPMEKDQRVGMSSARINAIGRGIQSCQRQLGAHALPHSSIPIPQAYLSKADTFV